MKHTLDSDQLKEHVLVKEHRISKIPKGAEEITGFLEGEIKALTRECLHENVYSARVWKKLYKKPGGGLNFPR